MEQSRLKKKPVDDAVVAIVEPALKVGAACGGMAFLFGGAAGIVRGVSPVLFATASSIQSFALGSIFTGCRVGIIRAWTPAGQSISQWDLTKASALAGCVAGGTVGSAVSFLARRRATPVPGAIMFTIFGAAGQHVYNKWSAPKEVVGMPKPGFWKRMSERSWSPVKVMTDEEYAEMLREKMLRVEVEIALLDDKIAAVKSQEKPASPEDVQK